MYPSHSLGDHWGTTQPGYQHSPFLSFLCSTHGVAQFQTCPILDVIFPSFSLSASPSPSPYSALEDCLGKSRSSCDMLIPLHFASFYSGQEFFIGSNGFPNPASHLFVGDVVFVQDAKETSETSHFHCLYLSLYHHHHYVPSVVNRSAVMDSIHDSLRYVHGGGPIPSTVTGHKSGSVKTVPVMCHTSYCHGF